jgi:DNA-binding response OmpR family regulator
VCVLLVEDEPLILEIMSTSLRDAGYEVVEATDGVQAMALFDTLPTPISILVTDFHMPGGLDGAQIASRMRLASPGVPVVVATGRPDVMQPSWRDELGYVLLRKPYLASELVCLVRKLAGAPPHHH